MKSNTKITHKRGHYNDTIVSRIKDAEVFYDITGEQGILIGQLDENDKYVNIIPLASAPKNDYAAIRKLTDYLYEVEYDSLDYAAAEKFFDTHYVGLPGGCSSVRKDNFYGRNFDWYYSERAEFVVKVPSRCGRHANVCVCSNYPALSNTFVESGAYSGYYKYIPHHVVDGINDAGVICSNNVVENISVVPTTGTNPGKPRLNGILIPRFVLDNFDNAEDAIEEIVNNRDVYMPMKDEHSRLELHYIISDSNHTYILEFVNNEAKIIDKSDTNIAFMTNFKLYDTSIDSNNHIIYESVHPFGNGLERYDTIADSIASINSTSDMLDLMTSIKYTNAYILETSTGSGLPLWKTELTGIYPDYSLELRVTDPVENFRGIFKVAKELYNRQQRDSSTWITQHTSIYNFEDKSIDIYVQEDYTKKFSFTCKSEEDKIVDILKKYNII